MRGLSGDSSSGAEYLALIAEAGDDRERACRHTESMLEEAHTVGWGPVERTLVPAVEALFLATIGEFAEAEQRARAAVVTAETETDNVWLQGWANEDLAMVLERAGRIDEARHALECALAVWEQKRCLPFVERIRNQLDLLGRAQV